MPRLIIAALIAAFIAFGCTDSQNSKTSAGASTSADLTPTATLLPSSQPTRVPTPQPTPTLHPCAPLVEIRDKASLEMAGYGNSAEWEAAEEAATTAVSNLSDALQEQMDYHPDAYVRDEAWALSQIFGVQILRELQAMTGGIFLTSDQGFEFHDSGTSLSEFLQKKGKLIERNDDPDETIRRIREAAFRAEVADYNARIARRAGLHDEERQWSGASRRWVSIADELRLLQSAHLAAANSVETCLEQHRS